MLSRYITDATDDLTSLIEYTKKDIEDAKSAEHEEVFNRNTLKEDSLNNFFKHKEELEQYMQYLLESQSSGSVEDILNEEDSKLFDTFKEKLFELKDLNKKFMKIIVILNDFYSNLLSKIVPHDMEGYNKTISNTNKFLEIKG